MKSHHIDTVYIMYQKMRNLVCNNLVPVVYVVNDD